MRFQYISYIWPLLISALATFLLGVYVLIRQRHSKYAVSFIVSMMIVTIWSAANALEMSGADLPTKLFWANIQYFAYCYSPLALLALCMRFTGYDGWLQSKKFLWLLLLPTVIFILVWSDGILGLIRYDIHLIYRETFPVIAKKYGPMFYVHAVYEHIINITAIIMLVRAVFYRKTVYRKQAIILFIGASLIVFPNILYITGFSPIKEFDITPVCFGPAGILMAWAIFRYKMFDLVPLARTTVIETMNTGVLVMDLQGRILDINPAFEKIMKMSINDISGCEGTKVFSSIPDFSKACADKNAIHLEFSTNTDNIRVFQAVFSPLLDMRGVMSGELIGRLAMVYDITDLKNEQQWHLEQQRRLAASREKEQLARDLHDNLGQTLGFINFQAQGIRQELAAIGNYTVSDKLDRLVEVTQAAHDEIRLYIKNVRSLSSSHINFMDSLKKTISQFEKQSDIIIEMDVSLNLADLDISQQAQLHIISIVKEALNNILKHSCANQVKITLSSEKERFLLSIEDNGKGFIIPDKTKLRGKSFGLRIMMERAAEAGSELSIKSEQGKGCRIDLSTPLSMGGRKILETYAGR